MVKLIRKIFIKDYQNVTDKKVREKHGLVANIGGILTNLVLFIIKLIIGILAGALSVISDAINNLTDMISCIVGLVGFKLASKPADEDHPFGHERIEYLTGMIVSFVIIAVAILLGYNAINNLINHEAPTEFEIYSFIILGIAILMKILLGLFYRGMGKAIDSVSLKANMQDSFNDVICTVAVLICAVIYKIWPNLWFVDSIASIGVAIFILFAGIELVKETADPLIGQAPDKERVNNIVNDVLATNGILGVHDVVYHSYGPTKDFITLHAEVDAYQNVMELHDMIDNIESKIAAKYSIEITIHMDPIDTRNPEIPLLKDKISEILKIIDERLTFHDLRLVAGPTHTNVLFDVVMPIKCEFKREDIINTLREGIKKMDEKYFIVVKIDSYYCH